MFRSKSLAGCFHGLTEQCFGLLYLEAADGRRIFYDVNANSNLRGPIGQAFGFDPFERVVDFLAGQISNLARQTVTVRDSQ